MCGWVRVRPGRAIRVHVEIVRRKDVIFLVVIEDSLTL